MPLKKGSSQKTVSSNIKEMMNNPSAKTKKAAATYAKEHGVSKRKALQKIAVAASTNSARRSKRKATKKKVVKRKPRKRTRK